MKAVCEVHEGELDVSPAPSIVHGEGIQRDGVLTATRETTPEERRQGQESGCQNRAQMKKKREERPASHARASEKGSKKRRELEEKRELVWR